MTPQRLNLKNVYEGKQIMDNLTYESYIIAKPRELF